MSDEPVTEETEEDAAVVPTLAERREQAVPVEGTPQDTVYTEEQAARDRLGWSPEETAAEQAEEDDVEVEGDDE